MESVRFKKLDAFAVNGSSGNPAGAVYLSHPDQLTPAQMQTIARELGGFVSEVGFLARLEHDHYWIRYYSSEREVAFCGHATIAIMYDIIKNTADLLAESGVHISTKNDRLAIENRIPESDCVFVTAPRPRFRTFNTDMHRLCAALGTDIPSIRDDKPVSCVNAGLETLVVPIATLKDILSISPDFEQLKAFCLNNSIDIVTLYCEDVSNKANSYRTRVFAPTFGYLEDPATGSGNAAFGHYLLANGMWDGALISLEQNGMVDRPNIVKLLARVNGEHGNEVLFGGNAVVKISGDYFLT